MSGIQRFLELKVGESGKEMQKEGRQKKESRTRMWKKRDQKQRITNGKITATFSTLPLKLRQYLCMFEVREDKDYGDRDWKY